MYNVHLLLVTLDGEYISTEKIYIYTNMTTTFGILFVVVLTEYWDMTLIKLNSIYERLLIYTKI